MKLLREFVLNSETLHKHNEIRVRHDAYLVDAQYPYSYVRKSLESNLQPLNGYYQTIAEENHETKRKL